MTNTLFVIPASHPCTAVRTALQRKGIAYRRIDLVPVLHRLIAPIAYGARTVPGMWLDGKRVAGSQTIMRRLDELVARPRMYPTAPAAAAGVDEADAWCDDVLQPLVRRMTWAVCKRGPEAMGSYAEGARLGFPKWLTRPLQPPVARMAAWANHATDASTRADLVALPGHLDRVDAWIADGTLGTESPNAADLQIGAALQLMSTLGDLAPMLRGRPAQRLTDVVIDINGDAPAGVLPASWLPASA